MGKTRTIETITKELHIALAQGKSSAISAGELLIEAKGQLDHGDWLTWLDTHFGLSARTAQSYMQAAEVAEKYDIHSERITTHGLRWLHGHAGTFTKKQLVALCDKTQPRWVSDETLIAAVAEREQRKQDRKDFSQRVEAQEDAEKILDAPPPDLPPPEPVIQLHERERASADQFKRAVESLNSVAVLTKPIATWVGIVPREQLRRARELLGAVEAETDAQPEEENRKAS